MGHWAVFATALRAPTPVPRPSASEVGLMHHTKNAFLELASVEWRMLSKKEDLLGIFLAVQQLGRCVLTAEDLGSIPG